jgi:hypothetical protein
LEELLAGEKNLLLRKQNFSQGVDEIGLDTVYNLITLSVNPHRSWDRGAFALKPISMSNDNMTLKVQFFWQNKKTRYSSNNESLDHAFFYRRP